MGSDAQDWALVFFFLLFVVVAACTAGVLDATTKNPFILRCFARPDG